MLTGVFLCGFDILLPLNYSVRIGNLESEHLPDLCCQSCMVFADVKVRTNARYVVSMVML